MSDASGISTTSTAASSVADELARLRAELREIEEEKQAYRCQAQIADNIARSEIEAVTRVGSTAPPAARRCRSGIERSVCCSPLLLLIAAHCCSPSARSHFHRSAD